MRGGTGESEMPTYEYRCSSGEPFDAFFALARVPDTLDCPFCGREATRRMTAPHLTAASASAREMLDRSARSADTPDVITGIPPAHRRAPGTQYTTNPAHQRLPRP
jgi:putative FmdB family regulatory protein